MTRPPCAKEPMSGTVSSTVEFWALCPWGKRSSVPIRFRRRPTEAGDHTSPWVDTTVGDSWVPSPCGLSTVVDQVVDGSKAEEAVSLVGVAESLWNVCAEAVRAQVSDATWRTTF